MTELPTQLSGVRLFELRAHEDRRGIVKEIYRESGPLDSRFPQDNVNFSHRNVLRGLHSGPAAKLVTVLQGAIWDVVVSPAGEWESYELSAENHRQLLVPAGFLHGFTVLSDSALVMMKLSEEFQPGRDRAVNAFDPDLNIAWPITAEGCIRSDADINAPSFESQ